MVRNPRKWILGLTGLGASAVSAKYFLHTEARDPGKYIGIPLPDNEKLIREVSPAKIVRRTVHLFFFLIPLAIAWPFVRNTTSLKLAYYRMLKSVLEATGPAFVKLGQWLVMRPDLCPPDLRPILGELHCRVTPHHVAYSKKLMRVQLGEKANDIVDFDNDSVGSGSIAQVHHARLKDGHEIAVKVCHPFVKQDIGLDFFCLRQFARAISWLGPESTKRLPELANQFATNLSLQVDLRFERDNLQHFHDNFKPTHDVVVPAPHPQYTTEQVLVEDFIHGVGISEYALPVGEAPTPLHDHIAKVGMDLYLQMVLHFNFIHADLHPGNLLIGFHPEDKEKQKPYMALLDVGIAQTLTKRERDLVFKFMGGIHKKDANMTAEALVGMGDVPANYDAFVGQIQELFNELLPKRAIQDKLKKYGLLKIKQNRKKHVTHVIDGIFDAVRDHNINMHVAWASLLASTVMIEGMAMSVAPTFDIVRFSAPYLLSNKFQSLTGHSPWGKQY